MRLKIIFFFLAIGAVFLGFTSGASAFLAPVPCSGPWADYITGLPNQQFYCPFAQTLNNATYDYNCEETLAGQLFCRHYQNPSTDYYDCGSSAGNNPYGDLGNAWVFNNCSSAGDNEAPSVVPNMVATGVSTNAINVTWDRATDNVGVVRYEVSVFVRIGDPYLVLGTILDTGVASYAFTDGPLAVSPATSFSGRTLTPNTTYTYRVLAYDAAGNYSASSDTGTTLSDATSPSAPAGLSASAVSSSQINLSWTASSDDIGVAGYRVYRDGAQVATTTAIAYSDTGLTPSTAYSYYVVAYDAAGNTSAQSNIASATTLTPPDTTDPSAPANLSASAVSSSQVNLSWTASTDNIGVAGYRVYRDGTQVATTAATAYSDTGLTPSTAYSYYVIAYDAAGNTSAQSNIASATTLTLPDTTAPAFTFTSPSALLPVGTASTALSGFANELAICRYSDTSGQNFDSMLAMAPTVLGINFIVTISGLSDGGLYAYYVKCRDNANNISGDFPISFAVDSLAPDSTPPVISNGAPTGVRPPNIGSVTISVRTNEPAWCSYNLNTDTTFANMVAANGTMQRDAARQYHWDSVSVANGVSYLYYIRCQDDPAGNENTTGYPISFSVANPPNLLPVAVMTVGPLSGNAPLEVTTDGRASYDTDGTIVYYTWQWGDSTPDTSDATADTASHTYTTPGTYIIRLTVRDNQSGVGTAQQTITVSAGAQQVTVSTTGICTPMCTQDSDCLTSGDICAPTGICVANGSGIGPGRSQGSFSLDGSTWQAAVVGIDTPPNFPANTASVMMSVQTDANAECQYSTTANAAYGNTTFMKQFYSTCVANTICATSLAVPKESVAAQSEQTYDYYVRCKDSQTNIVNNIDYHLSFTVGGPILISGPSPYVCWINQNFIRSGIPYLFDICRSECAVDSDCTDPDLSACDTVRKVCVAP